MSLKERTAILALEEVNLRNFLTEVDLEILAAEEEAAAGRFVFIFVEDDSNPMVIS